MFFENQSFYIALLLYSASALGYLMFFILRNEKIADYGSLLIKLALIFHTVSLTTRAVEASRLPLSNQYEFATSFAWGIAMFFVGFEKKYRFRVLGTFVTPLLLLIAFYAAMQNKAIQPLMPALQSKWLVIHVSTAIFSYGGFAIACGISIMYLLRDRLSQDHFMSRNMPSLETLDMLSYRAIATGFIMLTVVIVSGAIWADRAWGRYWQWDPKETWSFITWVIYAIYLHVRINKGWREKKAAWFAILGFISILFTYIGVNGILSGYHSYAMLVLNML